MESLDNYVVDGFSSEEFLIHSLHIIVFGVCVCVCVDTALRA